MPSALDVLYEDNHCLAVVKPARVPTAGDESGDLPLLEMAREYLRVKYAKPGKVYLGLVHRLDRPVSGVVLLARTSKAAARLSEQFRQGTVEKVYRAVVEGRPPTVEAELVDWLVKDSERNTARRVKPGTPNARESVLRYRLVQSTGKLALLDVRPRTGRSHQIRVQLAGQGTPIYGDRKYGASGSFGNAIALHAARLTFEHPTRREPMTLEAPLPSSWNQFAF